ncbi:MAG: hypothetical protein JSS86_15035, partial [Cyanobacteria bacterium SZAS LIN-2]|nr:hypothetical protein [Cyanobacteria bacterium SZAS LIN-2]
MLKKFLHKLDNTGEKGFEGLVRRLLRDLSGFEFRLSRSGSQHGRDARAVGRDSGSIMFECKNYESAKLKNRELIAELTEALEDDPSLDLWILAASTAVPEQSELQLRNLANKNGIEFIGLETGETDPGLLDCLCANSPDKLLEALGNVGASTTEIAEAKVAMSQIAALPGFLNRIEELRRQVTEPSLGWPAWRRSADKKWLNFVSDENSSRARFGQPLHLLSPATHLVSRREAMIALEDWWANWNINKSIFFMLGEEGDGKTWAVAQWLTNRIQTEGANSPPVIFISSKDAIGNGTMEEIILARIEQEFGRAKWKKRLRRWRKALSDQPERPFAIVVLDGLNERHNATYWRNVIDDSLAKEWKQSAAIICTARTGYWKEFFEPLSYLPTTRYVIKGYDNNEINNALSSRNQHLTDFPDTLHPLLRKPRYLDLAMKHRKELTECGDFTVARLIYEDWRDRYNRKSSFPLSNDQFNEMLKGLGKQFLDGQKQWQPNELISQFSLNEDSLQTFKELSTGGVLERVESGWQIQAQSLALGLGLLLCDQLKEAEQSQQDLQETLASWIEPCSGTDLISQALELAALHSLMTD